MDERDVARPAYGRGYEEDVRALEESMRMVEDGVEASSDVDVHALALGMETSARVIETCGAHYTAWAHRWRCAEALAGDAGDGKMAVLREEAAYAARATTSNAKNYQAWNHARRTMETMGDEADVGDRARAFEHVDAALASDGKNIHAWQQRAWLVSRFNVWDGEDAYTRAMIAEDVMNNSAWNARFYWAKHMFDRGDEEVLDRETAYAREALESDAENESVWSYLRGLRDFAETSPAPLRAGKVRLATRCSCSPTASPPRRFETAISIALPTLDPNYYAVRLDRLESALRASILSRLTLDDLRYERDLDSLIEDVGLLDADAEKFRVALKRALSADKTTNSEKKSDGREEPSSNDLARAVASAVASSRARQGLDGGSGTARGDAGVGGAVRMGGAKASDHAPKLSVDAVIEDILDAHREKDFLRLLKLRDVPMDNLGRVDWGGHEAMKTTEIAMRCKLLTLRLDSSRNSHPLAARAKRAVKNTLDLLSHKDTRKEYLTLAVRNKVEKLRAQGKLTGGGYVSITGVHYGTGAAAVRAAEENYVSKDMMNEIPTYDASIHAPDAELDAIEVERKMETKKTSAPKVDVSSIRAKLASKNKKPKFM
ncbi:protein farnesyltransferase [Ostreococcus tauri]|uniref:Protein farnesyltransferase/geranylgeranyltransferase type-1 subunit alpha n=1 Tax=Ostreococcus tauri TaxID=70448 RepID=A0A1Y5I178_OSTTA|nr:protein farnesyltransferase [Ostreococcus tauri]